MFCAISGQAAEKAVVVALAAKAAAEEVYITAMDAHKASERLDSVAGDKVTAADSELAELQQQESYDKMLANPKLTRAQRAQLVKMRSKRAAKENAKGKIHRIDPKFAS